MSQDIDPSIIEYARFHGLVQDHRQPDPMQALASLRPQFFEETIDLSRLDLEDIKIPEERLAVDTEVASLLSSVLSLAKEVPSYSDEDVGIYVHRAKKLKQELPLLSSDHELDLLNFVPRIVPNLEDEFLPLENLDEEADEGLTWPSKYYELPEIYDRKSRSEKFEISSDAMLALQESLRYDLDGGAHEAFKAEGTIYHKKSRNLYLSPPLLPLSPGILPHVPSSEAGHLDLLSDHTSPSREESRQIERIIFSNDKIKLTKRQLDSSSQSSDPMLLESDSLGDIYSPLRGIKDLPSSPPALRARLRDRKVEVPLEPAEPQYLQLSKRKNVTFSEALPELIPELPPPTQRPGAVSSSDIDEYFAEIIAPIAAGAERKIEQEKLQEADTMLRVIVPIMDFTLPVAPWETSLNGSRAGDVDNTFKQGLHDMKSLHFSKHFLPVSGQAERELKWAPFPAALGKFEATETISDNGSLERYLRQPETVDVSTLTWKPDELRIFEEIRVNCEDDLEEAIFSREKDITSLIRKRKFELEAFDIGTSSAGTETKAKIDTISDPTMNAAYFAASDELDQYLNVRTGIFQRQKSPLDSQQTKVKPIEIFTRHGHSKAVCLSENNIPSSIPSTSYLASPSVELPITVCPFVVSAYAFKNRKLLRKIQGIFPSAEFIERDFRLHQDVTAHASSEVAGLGRGSSLNDEADMILSPSTGLIWTTLQKVKQCSLPGQLARSAIKERIIATSLRYERLIILISDDRIDLDHSDCEALVDINVFCSALLNYVQVIFIVGGEDDLAKWIVAVMVKQTVPGTRLIQDETLWEVFLRRAGMNAFSAQAILGTLKALEHNDVGRRTLHQEELDSGLPVFVRMPFETKVARFETLLGGRRLLRRVNDSLNARW